MTDPGGDQRSSRRFSIVDGMILVGAMSVWFAAQRVLDVGENIRSFSVDYVLPNLTHAGPPLWAWAVGTLLLGLRRRDLPLGPWFRRPGIIATVVAIAFGMIESLMVPAQSLLVGIRGGPPLITEHATHMVNCIRWVGPSVAAAWLTLALTGTWSPAPDWVDRSGRLLGVVLIALWVLVHAGV